MTIADVERMCRVEGLPGLAVLPPHENLATIPGAVAFIHPPFCDFVLVTEGFRAMRLTYVMGRGKGRLRPDGDEPLVDWLRRIRARILREHNLTGGVLGFEPVD